MKKLAFNTNDLMLLQQLGEYHLYLLNVALLETAAFAKGRYPSRTKTVQLVALAETAAKEVACRNRWSPIAVNGFYTTDGISYDTPQLRNWLNSYRKKLSSNIPCSADTFELLEQFSFGDSIFEIKRTA